MESTGLWGGQPEILALSRAFSRQINVVQVGFPTLKVGEEDFGAKHGGDGGAVFISYHRKMYGLGEVSRARNADYSEDSAIGEGICAWAHGNYFRFPGVHCC